MCRARKVFFHTDAAQAVGKVPVNVDDMKVDLMSISAHKLYGPKGVGALALSVTPPEGRHLMPVENVYLVAIISVVAVPIAGRGILLVALLPRSRAL